jgi:hypothetical protein
MRLGLRLEQRSDVRRLVDLLSRRMRQAGDDLAAAVAEVRLGGWQQYQVHHKLHCDGASSAA